MTIPFSSLTEVLDMIKSMVVGIISSETQICEQLASVRFEPGNLIYDWLGAYRYLCGGTLWNALVTLAMISCGLALWRLVSKLINLIIGIIPGVSGGAA